MPRIHVIVAITTIDAIALDLRRRLTASAAVYGKPAVEYSVDTIDLVDDVEPNLLNIEQSVRRGMALDGTFKKAK